MAIQRLVRHTPPASAPRGSPPSGPMRSRRGGQFAGSWRRSWGRQRRSPGRSIRLGSCRLRGQPGSVKRQM
jgi:hypothetical protein